MTQLSDQIPALHAALTKMQGFQDISLDSLIPMPTSGLAHDHVILSGRDLLLRMLPHYDVFIENYGPGVVEKLDIGYDLMKAIHPELIYVRIKGFGTSGPRSHYKSMDMVAQASAGAFSVTGEPDGPPMRPGATTWC